MSERTSENPSGRDAPSESPGATEAGNAVVDENDDTYSPNHIPRAERLKNVLMSGALLAYGTFGLWIDDLFLPSKRGSGLHLHGLPVWVMYLAMILASANLLAVVVDHYDQRNNEHNYRRFAKLTQILGWAAFALALVLHVLLTISRGSK